MVPVFLLSLAYIVVEGVLPMELNVKVVKQVKNSCLKKFKLFYVYEAGATDNHFFDFFFYCRIISS